MVVLLVGSCAFTFGFVELRIQRLFGTRVAALAKRLEAWFDRSTRGPGASPTHLHRAVRRVVRAAIGTEPLTTREQLTQNYLETFRALARFEHLYVVLMAYPGVGAHAHTPRDQAQRKLFFDDMRAAADRHHFGWVDLRQHFDGSRDFSGFAVEELHFNLAGHQRSAAAMGPAVAAMLAARVS